MYEQPELAKYQGPGGGAEEGFCNNVRIKRKLTTALGFRYKLYISDKMNFGVVDDGVVADLSKGILNIQKYKILGIYGNTLGFHRIRLQE